MAGGYGVSDGRDAREQPEISLVLATYGTGHDLDRFFDSVIAQDDDRVEIIVVDQNATDEVRDLCKRYANELTIRHMTAQPGLSRARNVGIARCRGAIIAFPDDDCWYPAGLLAAVRQQFARDPDLDGMTCRCTDEHGRLAAGGDGRRPGPITKHNVWMRGVSATLFLRADTVRRVGFFDESLGLGSSTDFKSGEETDYILRVIAMGGRMIYLPSLRVFHPLPPTGCTSGGVARSWSYGLGWGRVLRKHRYDPLQLVYHFAYPLLGSLVALLRRDPALARLRIARLLGRWQGWRWRPGLSISRYRWLQR